MGVAPVAREIGEGLDATAFTTGPNQLGDSVYFGPRPPAAP